MVSASMSPKWAAILATVLTARSSTALYQSYCSSENTGSDYSAVYNQFMSNGACFTNCQDDYAFAIVQYQDCWCSNYIPAEQLSVSECNVECPGFGQENCGNKQDGLFGYVALSRSPSGTAGGFSSPTTSASAETTTPFVSFPTTTTAPPSSSTTTSQVVTPSSTTPPIDSTVTSIVTETPATSSTTSKTATPVTSTQVVTISGAIVTQTVTTTPSPVPSSGSDQEGVPTKSSSNNTGAIVGGVIGGIAGLVLILAAVFFCFRRRNAGHPTTTSKLDRNASILSRAGLVASTNNNNRDPEKTAEDAYGGQRGSGNFNENENSSVTNSGGVYERSDSLGRRNSRPLVYDQRLNPAALMENWQLNGSRSSINTMQDQRDYSRPLGITNPDPHDGI